jgi:hypothetical protein
MRYAPVIRVTRQFLDQGPIMNHGVYVEETSAENALKTAKANAEPGDKIEFAWWSLVPEKGDIWPSYEIPQNRP